MIHDILESGVSVEPNADSSSASSASTASISSPAPLASAAETSPSETSVRRGRPRKKAAPAQAPEGESITAQGSLLAEEKPAPKRTPRRAAHPRTAKKPALTEDAAVAEHTAAQPFSSDEFSAAATADRSAPAASASATPSDAAKAENIAPAPKAAELSSAASGMTEAAAETEAAPAPQTPRTYEEWIFADAAQRAARKMAEAEAEAKTAEISADAPVEKKSETLAPAPKAPLADGEEAEITRDGPVTRSSADTETMPAALSDEPKDESDSGIAGGTEPAAEEFQEQPARKAPPRSRRGKNAAQAVPQAAEALPTAEVREDTAPAVPSIAIADEAEVYQAGMRDDAQSTESDAAEPEEEQCEAGSDADNAAEDTAPLRKNRRGRRGGRSRKHRGKSELEDAVQMEAVPLKAVPVTEADDTDDEEEEIKPLRPVNCRRRMFISVLPSEQVEVAITEDGIVQEYYLEMRHQAKMKGNIYKGIIHNIDMNLQAAFVTYGGNKNGFLQIDEIHPEYFQTHHEPMKGKKYPPIQKVLRCGQEVLVQVVKEPNGSKGAFLTTWLSLAGRFLVLTPGQEQIGISRKVENDEERSRLREMMTGIEPGEGLGVIVRTVSAGTSKTTLKNDLQYLKRVWKDIRKRGTADAAPCLIYQEPGLAERAVRDYLTEDVSEIWVDNAEIADAIRETANLLFPRRTDLVKVHADSRQGMWERFNLQRQLEQIYAREVTLPSGGRLVFDQTEALLAIDINSGKISGKTNFEAMAHRTNMEAAEAIARQLKLRDIGGQVVIDFIEMRDKNHVRDVEKTLRVAMKNDRARHDVSRMSNFGLLELVRQRTGSSALSITMEPCPHCGGTGLRRNMEWQALQALRDIRRMLAAARDERCVYAASAEVGMYLLNNKRQTLQQMEQASGKSIEITIRP